MNQSVDF